MQSGHPQCLEAAADSSVCRSSDNCLAKDAGQHHGELQASCGASGHELLHCIVKPWDNDKLIATLMSAYEASAKVSKPVVRNNSENEMYWGDSPAMDEIRHTFPDFDSLRPSSL